MTHSVPAMLQKISIEHTRCFRETQQINLNPKNQTPPPFTIILGDNGTGKTTLLQAIAVACHPLQSYADQRLAVFKSKGVIYLEIKEPNQLRDTTKTRHDTTSTTSYPPNRTGIQLDPNCFGYGASRRMSAQSIVTQESSPIETLFGDDALIPNCEEWLLQIDYASRLQDDQEAKNRVETVKTIICRILPDVSNIRINVRGEGRSARPFVEAETPYNWVPLTELSSGYRTMLAWVLDLARNLYENPAPGYDGLDSPAVVLVDEIDLHLHPQWQRDLIPRLSEIFPNAQFIVTAHSPLIVQAVPDANIVVLRREGDHVVIDNNPKSVLGWRVDQLLTSDLFGLESARPPALDALLEERRQLLSKPEIGEAEEARLAEIRAELDALPYGEDEDEMKARDLIARVAKRLEELGEE